MGNFPTVLLDLFVRVHFRVCDDDLVENAKTHSRNFLDFYHLHVFVLMQATLVQDKSVIVAGVVLTLKKEVLADDYVQFFSRLPQ